MQVVMPPEGAFAHAPKLQHVPILIGDDGSYPIEANRYLDERSNGEWQLPRDRDRKSTRLNSSHTIISYAVFCLKKKKDLNTTAGDERALGAERPLRGRRAPRAAPRGSCARLALAFRPALIRPLLFFFFKKAAPPKATLFPPRRPFPA